MILWEVYKEDYFAEPGAWQGC